VTTPTLGQFQLHLPGLLKVLAEHLYSSQRVGVRELLQNAHDSCVRRAAEQSEVGYRPRIDITMDNGARILRVADNGSGLTAEEIHTYLIVIGRGYTSELRERLAVANEETSIELIGQFGIGFLAAYLLASEVVMETKSAQHKPLRWRSVGDQEFEISEGSREHVGTTIELKLKPSAFYLLRERVLIDVIREYADFLPTAIHVENSSTPVNLRLPPWDQPDWDNACRDYARRRFNEAELLCILPLTDGKVDLGHDSITVPLRGFLFVPAKSVVSVKEYGTLAVYIRRMAICDADKDLLPPWARFVRGVVDCPALQPTASREAVHQDAAFDALRQVLAEQLGNGLRQIAATQPDTWQRIVYGHTDLVMGWASKDADFFRLVAESVPLRTSRGQLPLPEYLRQSGRVVYYTTRELGSLQDKILAEGRDVPAIDASWFGVQPFLERYAQTHSDVRLVRLDDSLDTLLLPDASAEYGELFHLCEELGFTVRTATFRPIHLPAVMTYPADAEMIRSAKSALDQGLIPEGFSSLMQNFIQKRQASSGDEGTLHLNTACPLIQRLASGSLAVERKQAALAVIAYFAKLFCGRMIDANEAIADLKAWRNSLERLVEP
jgi:molecular chaperone HtpG